MVARYFNWQSPIITDDTSAKLHDEKQHSFIVVASSSAAAETTAKISLLSTSFFFCCCCWLQRTRWRCCCCCCWLKSTFVLFREPTTISIPDSLLLPVAVEWGRLGAADVVKINEEVEDCWGESTPKIHPPFEHDDAEVLTKLLFEFVVAEL